MNDSKLADIGGNWVSNPNHAIEAIEEEFDLSASAYEKSSLDWDYRGANDGAAFFTRHVSSHSRVVDVGCGSGLVGQRLSELGFDDLTGCDISSAMLAIAREKNLYSGGLYKTEIQSMPLEANAFDALICIAVLTYVPDMEPVFAEFERVVRPSGRIIFSHRIDLEPRCGFSEALSRRLNNNTWHRIEVSEPMLYYPRKADYTDQIKVRYHAYSVQ